MNRVPAISEGEGAIAAGPERGGAAGPPGNETAVGPRGGIGALAEGGTVRGVPAQPARRRRRSGYGGGPKSGLWVVGKGHSFPQYRQPPGMSPRNRFAPLQ